MILADATVLSRMRQANVGVRVRLLNENPKMLESARVDDLLSHSFQGLQGREQ
jgi:hypothetical protein